MVSRLFLFITTVFPAVHTQGLLGQLFGGNWGNGPGGWARDGAWNPQQGPWNRGPPPFHGGAPPPPFQGGGPPPPFQGGGPPPPFQGGGPPIPPPRGPPPPNGFQQGNGFGDLEQTIGGIMQAVGGVAAEITRSTGGEDILGNFRAWSRGPPPPEHVWRRRARRFCRRFPGHPKCSGGRTPLFAEIGSILNAVAIEGGKFLPRVPKLFIKDYLAGVNPELANIARAFVLRLGQISEEAGMKIRVGFSSLWSL